MWFGDSAPAARVRPFIGPRQVSVLWTTDRDTGEPLRWETVPGLAFPEQLYASPATGKLCALDDLPAPVFSTEAEAAAHVASVLDGTAHG